MKHWLQKYFWVIGIILLALIVLIISLLPDSNELKSITGNVLGFLESLSVIVVGVLGLIWAYPFLKRKATETYATKMADIIFEANKNVRALCSELLDKYPSQMRSNELTTEYVVEALNDTQKLYSISREANYDAYRYAYLLYSSIKEFNKMTSTKGIPKDFYSQYFKEDFSSFVHLHIEQVLQYASTVTSIAQFSVKNKKTLVKPIDKYVCGNEVAIIPGVDGRINYFKSDALLVLFFYNNNTLPERVHMLREACFKSAPSVSPYARLFEHQHIYAPLMLQCKSDIVFEKLEVCLVGYKHMVSQKLEDASIEHYTILYYSNISHIGFVPAFINREVLPDLEDEYIGHTVFKKGDIIDFWAEDERFAVKISRNVLEGYYKSVEKQLKRIMKKETK